MERYLQDRALGLLLILMAAPVFSYCHDFIVEAELLYGRMASEASMYWLMQGGRLFTGVVLLLAIGYLLVPGMMEVE